MKAEEIDRIYERFCNYYEDDGSNEEAMRALLMADIQAYSDHENKEYIKAFDDFHNENEQLKDKNKELEEDKFNYATKLVNKEKQVLQLQVENKTLKESLKEEIDKVIAFNKENEQLQKQVDGYKSMLIDAGLLGMETEDEIYKNKH